ncbi:alkaline phosphatase PafA [Croceivirga thetidis]|uniref:Alkaline phosphatase family protein n=1 Tax=Croceivirga thetidis TaxID=2721623 RepID=A0ABX1GW89_9FLAO|nr:alkaline phosphatase PafA [Croceivirga thetidis]NKI33281.1 alkaline phosphatase family protein [Croceivirga thetidis]
MRNQYIFLTILFFVGCSLIHSQRKNQNQEESIAANPKLVVGIVVDQMRYDYLTRFWSHYGEGGFKRMVREGFNCKNHHFNYAPTSTGPGHASVYTGTTPAVHGIIGNDWYDKLSDESVYVASDDSYESIGTDSEAGKMSPHRMLTSTITDQNRLHTQFRGKTIAIALKDRGAVLPGGHTANAAYWFEGGKEGNWITSSFYMNELPKWVVAFNTSNAVESYKKPWTTLKPISEYVESGTDQNIYEGRHRGEIYTRFPHDLPTLWDQNGQTSLLRVTAYGNSITTDFALAALKNEDLGEDDITDFLTVSFSSTDYVGHMYGVNSVEVQDTYLRLDKDLERLFSALDKKVGKENYTVFLTADHGAIHVPNFLKEQKIPAGYLNMATMKARFLEFLKYKYNTTDVVKNISNFQVFLDRKVIDNLEMDLDDVEEEIASEFLRYTHIDKVFTGTQLWQNSYPQSSGIPYLIQKGWNQKRSGDIVFVQKPGYIAYPLTGSTHGSPMIYDTHVPLLLMGNGIKHGETASRTEIPDIAPTLAVLLGTAFPNGTTGTPIVEVLD